MGKRLVDRKDSERKGGTSMKKFSFSSLTANTGMQFSYDSSEMFGCPEDEREVRDIAERAFRGEAVPLPGSKISVTGQKMGKEFMFKFFPTDSSASGDDHSRTALYVTGTAESGKAPMHRANDMHRIFYGVPCFDKMTPPSGPYSVDVCNATVMPWCDLPWFLAGMSGQYSKALACVAIDMLKGAA